MKISKVIKYIIVYLVFAVLLVLVTVTLSSIMQEYYKCQIDNFTKSSVKLLTKKSFWTSVGEFPVLLYICASGSLLITSIIAIIFKIKKI